MIALYHLPLHTRLGAESGGGSAGFGVNDDDFAQKLMRLKDELQGSAHYQPTLEEMLGGSDQSAPGLEGDAATTISELRKENERLRQIVEQGRQRLAQVEREAEQWKARELEYERMLEEKSEQIRQMHHQLQMQPKHRPDGPTEEELIALHQELQRERELLEQDRAVMDEQFKEMEMQMSRERAEIGRERAEVRRLQAELKRQLDLLEREAKGRGGDATVLARLREELTGGRSSSQGQRTGTGPHSPPSSPLPDLPTLDRKAPAQENPRKSFFGGLFGGNKES
jgi:chromosome segregation ATPase